MSLRGKLVGLTFMVAMMMGGCDTSSIIGDDEAATTPAPVQEATPAQEETPTTELPVINTTTIVTTSGESIQVKETAAGFIFVGYEGKVILLEFYGDTCPHCVDSIPRYNNIQAKYSNDLVVISVETYGRLDDAGLKAFAKSNGMQYRTVASENSGNLRAHAESLVGPFGGVPYLFVIDRDGEISSSILADLSEAQITSMFQGLI